MQSLYRMVGRLYVYVYIIQCHMRIQLFMLYYFIHTIGMAPGTYMV